MKKKKNHPPVTVAVKELVFPLSPLTHRATWALNEVTYLLTSGHYYPVIMCCSAWLHLLFLLDKPYVKKKAISPDGWWYGDVGEVMESHQLSASAVKCTLRKSPGQLKLNTSFFFFLPKLWGLFHFSSCAEFHSLRQYLLVILNQTASQLYYRRAMEKLLTYFQAAQPPTTDS